MTDKLNEGRLLTDFSKMVFEEKTLPGGMREIRVVAPNHATVAMKDRAFTGTEARKKMIRYILANAAGLAPHLAEELEAVAARIHEEIDAEGIPS